MSCYACDVMPEQCDLHWDDEVTVWHCAIHGPEPGEGMEKAIDRVRFVLLHKKGMDWPDIDPDDIEELLKAYDHSQH